MATALGWDVLFNGLPKQLQSVDRTKERLGHIEYRKAKQIIIDAANNGMSVEEIKTILDDECLVWNEEQRTKYINYILKEIGKFTMRKRKPRSPDIADQVRELVIQGVEAGKVNALIYKDVMDAGFDGYYSYSSLGSVCARVRKELGAPRGTKSCKRDGSPMSAKEYQRDLINHWTNKCQELLQTRANLTRDDLEYLAEKTAAMKDERLKECVATLIGWGDDERAELETFCAIALETMKSASAYKLREAARKVEIRYLHKNKGV